MRHHQTARRGFRVLGCALVVGLAFAACGSDDDDAASTISPESTEAPSSTAGTTPETTPSDDAFPVTFETKFGTTVIETKPERVVSVGYTEGDLVLALGVTPLAVRDWYGDQPNALWPWAAESPAAQAGEIAVIPSAQINFEQVSALEPDVIFAIGAGITQADFDTLADIAPVVAQSGEYNEFGTPWDVAQLMIGKALGMETEAQALVDDVKGQIADVVAAHPDWTGKSGSVAVINADKSVGAFTDGDNRGHMLTQLGFAIPDEVTSAAGDSFYAALSLEQLDLVDTDLLLYTSYPTSDRETIEALPLVQQMQAVIDGRAIFLDDALGGAMAFSSSLSIPYALELLVPQIEAALP